MACSVRGKREISNRCMNVFGNGSNKLCACAHLSYAIELLNLIKKTSPHANANPNTGKIKSRSFMSGKKKCFACRGMNLCEVEKKSMNKIARRAACSKANTIKEEKESVIINYEQFENAL